MKKVIKMKDLMPESTKQNDNSVNERGNTPWGMVDPEIDPQTGMIYANDIPLTLEDCMELYDVYLKTSKNITQLASHHPGIKITPIFEIELTGETDTHRFDGKQIKTLYDFAMANRNRIATRNDLTGGRQKSDTIRQLHTNILKNK